MDSPLALVGLPIALGIIMFGLGLGLTSDDFVRVVRFPKAAVVALVCQVLLLPCVAFGLALAVGLPDELAVGLMLLAASPGGTMANLYSHLFGGHVALNVTLTAINSVLAVVTLPLVVNYSASYFLDSGATIGLQFDKIAQVFAIVLVPVAIGMLVRRWRSDYARSLDRPVRIVSVLLLVAVIVSVLLKERGNVPDYFASVGLAVLAFNVISLVVGYGAPRLLGVDHRASTAAGFEIGIHNSALAITIALSPALLNSAAMAVPAAVYGIVMLFTAAIFGVILLRLGRRAAPAIERVSQ
jgi:BASS family bile acid:Na+ symporter